MRSQLLLIRPDKGGDAIKTLPALRAIKAEFQHWEIHVLCSQDNRSIFKFEPDIHRHLLPKNWLQLSMDTIRAEIQPKLPRWFEKAILLPCDPTIEQVELLNAMPAESRYSVRPKSLMPHWSKFYWLNLTNKTPAKRSEVENIADICSQAVQMEIIPLLRTASNRPAFCQEDQFEAQKIMGTKGERWLGFCPFAGLENRSHSIERWSKFIVHLSQKSDFDRYFIFGTEGDRARMDAIRMTSRASRNIQVCCPTSFRALGAYMKRLDGLITVDSGPLHMAIALGVPSLGLLSGGDVKRWFPSIGPKDKIVRRGLIDRFPNYFEMLLAYRSWHRRLFSLQNSPQEVVFSSK